MQIRHLEAVSFSAKAAISALFGVVTYQCLHLPGSVWVVAVSAVIVTQTTLDSSLKASSLRVVANLGGALIGLGLSLAIGIPLAAMTAGILLTGLACYVLKQEDMLRPAAVAVILVTLAGEGGQWDTSRKRVLGVIVGCVCAVVVGFIFDKILKHTKFRDSAKPEKTSAQE